MPEMTPDPGLERLARFTPDASAVDPAEILFRAGRASARTPLGWKLAVAGLLLTSAAAVGLLLFRGPERVEVAAPPPEPLPVPVAVPVVVPAPEPDLSPAPAALPSRWSVGALIGTTDVDRWPDPTPVPGMAPTGPPLTPLAARRGGLD